MKISRFGLILALLYVLVASYVSWDDFFNCKEALLTLCGLGSVFLTFPISLLFHSFGLEVHFINYTDVDIALQALIILMCGVLVYFIGWVIGWIGARVLNVLRRA